MMLTHLLLVHALRPRLAQRLRERGRVSRDPGSKCGTNKDETPCEPTSTIKSQKGAAPPKKREDISAERRVHLREEAVLRVVGALAVAPDREVLPRARPLRHRARRRVEELAPAGGRKGW